MSLSIYSARSVTLLSNIFLTQASIIYNITFTITYGGKKETSIIYFYIACKLNS